MHYLCSILVADHFCSRFLHNVCFRDISMLGDFYLFTILRFLCSIPSLHQKQQNGEWK